MKKFFSQWLYTVIGLLLVASCKKDLDTVTLDTASAASPKLSATESNIVLMEARENNTAIVFNWTKPEFNFPASFRYTLQFARAGTNFANPVNESAGTDRTKAFTEKALNSIALGLGIPAGTQGSVEVRLMASANDSVPLLYSNVQTLTLTPYSTDQFLHVPGSYQGWDPAKADIIRSVAKNKRFEGYINFTAPAEFKFTDAPNWNNGIFGDKSTGTSGEIASPGNNFKVASAGYYRINADLNANTWSATRTAWGLIGSATPGGWGSDQDMTYDATAKKWTVTLNLTQGDIKFRANDDWPINLGDDGANGSLEYNGANIAISSAGNYTVTLDLSDAGRYTYNLKKN